MTNLTWILETDIFPNGHARLVQAAEQAGHRVIPWSDDWWTTAAFPISTGPAVFHGSLGNADRVGRELAWRPGAFCNTQAFCCSSYYPMAKTWLINGTYEIAPANAFAADPAAVLAKLGDPDRVFVRPDSPLKPFAGRVLNRDGISLEALDHGFYFEDETIPVVVAPTLTLGTEWRFVVSKGQVVTGSAYDPVGRRPNGVVHTGPAWEVAEQIAAALPAPDPVFVLDLCEHEGGIGLLELNPFSGADLYDCDRSRIVEAVARVALPKALG